MGGEWERRDNGEEMGAFVRGARSGWAALVALFCCASLALLVSCGGGSGSGEDQIATNPTAPVIQSVSVASAEIDPGGSTQVTANFTGGTGVISPGSITVQSGVAVPLSPSVTTEYTLTVTGAGGTVTRTFTVTVRDEEPELLVSPLVVTAGGDIRVEVRFPKGTATLEPGFGAVNNGDVKIYRTSLLEAGSMVNFALKVDHSSFVASKIKTQSVSVVYSPRIEYFVLE